MQRETVAELDARDSLSGSEQSSMRVAALWARVVSNVSPPSRLLARCLLSIVGKAGFSRGFKSPSCHVQLVPSRRRLFHWRVILVIPPLSAECSLSPPPRGNLTSGSAAGTRPRSGVCVCVGGLLHLITRGMWSSGWGGWNVPRPALLSPAAGIPVDSFLFIPESNCWAVSRLPPPFHLHHLWAAFYALRRIVLA